MRVCPECGARYGDQAGFCPMDGSRLDAPREEPDRPAAGLAPAPAPAPASAAPPSWSGFGGWPAGLVPGQAAPRFAPPPSPRSPAVEPAPPAPAPVVTAPVLTAPVVAEAPVVTAPVVAEAPVVAAPPVVVAAPVDVVPAAVREEPVPVAVERPVSQREPTMRWQPTASGPRPVASATWTAAPAVELPSWEPPAWTSPRRADLDQEEDLLGRVLADRYRVEESIGAGGMGVVYRATHVLIDKRVAVKVLRRRFAKQPDLSERFAREAKVASSIKHPNVVDVLDFGTTPGGCPFCVMEFLDGHSLAREIDQRGRLPPAFALELGIQVARGLAAAHQAGAIHRDLKPENVFLVPTEDDEGRRGVTAKILDFGIARLPANKLRLTAAGSVIGTPEYMSPEQARGDEVDARSDLYALGVMLFEAISGQVPLQGDSLAGTLTKQVFEAPPTLREIDVRLEGLPSIEAVLARLLAKSRDERPPDALAVVRLLATAMANDLGAPDPALRPQAALDGWSRGDARNEAPRRRSTVMIGSGAITSAHTAVRVGDGPATGDFDAKQGEVPSTGKRPSVIVDGTPARLRPARVVAQSRTDLVLEPIAPERSPASENVVGRTREPTPEPGPSRELRRRKRKRAFRQHLPILALAVGAAIFAGLVTVGFVQWWQWTRGDGADVGRE